MIKDKISINRVMKQKSVLHIIMLIVGIDFQGD